MNKYFVTLEQALALKELSFDEPCLAFYWRTGWFRTVAEYPHYVKDSVHVQNQLGDYDYDSTSAPLYSQAFEWFRSKHQLFPEVIMHIPQSGDLEGTFTYTAGISHIEGYEKKPRMVGIFYPTHQQAESACLDELIKIVKTC